MAYDNPTPAEVDQVHAETRDDLERLLAAVPPIVEMHGPIRGAVELATSLIFHPSWTKLELGSVLGLALVRITELTAQRDEARRIANGGPGEYP